MRKILTFLLFMAAASVSTAQPAGYKKLNDDTEFRRKLTVAAANTTTLKSDFTQVKNLSMLDEKVTSNGIFRFKKENKVRMEYLHPYQYLLVINGDKVSIRDQQKANSFSARSNKLFTIINNIIIDCVQGTALNNKDFNAELFTGEKGYLVKLVPAKKELKEFFSYIHVFIDPKDFTVQKFDMIEPSGDNTLITFTNKEINAPLPDSDFVVK